MENTKNQDNKPIPPIHLPNSEQTPSQRKPLSLFRKLLIIVFFVVSSFGVYDILFPSQPQPIPTTTTNSPSVVLSPTAQQNSGWKTYTNQKYNYAIDFPKDWADREFPDTQNGAGFRLANTPNNLCCEIITISYSPKIGNYKDLPFENYVTVAGTGIQNFQELKSSKKITTSSGIVGYVTTWQITPLIGGAPVTSDPITFFPAKNDSSGIIMVTIEDENESNQLGTYDKMISTFQYTN